MYAREPQENDNISAPEAEDYSTLTLREVKEAIHQLKPNKAAYKDTQLNSLRKIYYLSAPIDNYDLGIRTATEKKCKKGVNCLTHKKDNHLESIRHGHRLQPEIVQTERNLSLDNGHDTHMSTSRYEEETLIALLFPECRFPEWPVSPKDSSPNDSFPRKDYTLHPCSK